MQTALKGKPLHVLEQPSGIVSIRIDPMTGKRASASDPNAMFEYFMLPHVPETDNGVYVASPSSGDVEPGEAGEPEELLY